MNKTFTLIQSLNYLQAFSTIQTSANTPRESYWLSKNIRELSKANEKMEGYKKEVTSDKWFEEYRSKIEGKSTEEIATIDLEYKEQLNLANEELKTRSEEKIELYINTIPIDLITTIQFKPEQMFILSEHFITD